MGQARDGRASGDLVVGEGWRYVQYQLAVPAGEPPADVELVLLDTSGGPRVTGPLASEPGLLEATRPAIISRAGWGCNESYRYDSSGSEIWPREYRTVQKAIVHHTVTSDNGVATVQSIYYYHAVEKGWGDIGYNYLVDKWGNIYEGRAGGENVVGGHALQYNYGSTGIACLGDFRYAYPSTAMKAALARITAWTCRYLDPHGQSYFVDKVYPNICGHLDVMSTECPGSNLYAYLPALRDAVQGILGSPSPRLSQVSFTQTRLPQGEALRVEVTVVNAGGGTMNTQGPAPGYRYQEGQDFQAVETEKIGAFRVAVGFEGEPGVDHPYRWGLPGPLGPGQSTTVVGYIQLNTLQQRNYWVGLVEEHVRWWVDQTGTTTIKVVPAYCFAPTASAEVPQAAAPVALGNLPHRLYLPLTSLGPCD